MRLVAVFATVLGVAGCAPTSVSVPPQNVGALPFDVGNGSGGQYGNYEMKPAGETRDASGDRCVIFNWDRPLDRNFAVRYASLSCESKEHPNWMTPTPYVRTIIPLSESNLKLGQSETQQ
jgi:hypothetical protein